MFASPANGRSQLPSSTPSKDVHRLLRAYPKPAGSPQAASLPTQLAADGADHEDPFGGGSITTSQRQKTHDLFPTKLSLLPYNLSPALPLPEHYASLLTLHIALEHALVVHLATAGAGAASSEQQGDDHAVRLPNLITYSALRPLVERTGGRRLGSEELARLVWVWSDVGSSGEEKSQRDQDQDKDADVGGLGFLVNRTRTLDARTGKRTWDWGLGIELSLSRALGSATARRPQTPPVEVSFRNAATAAPSSPVPSSTSSPAGPSTPTRRSRTSSGEALLASPRRRNDGLRTGREGMSLVALWNNGIEVRKMEVARRLRERAGRLHQAWLDSPACTSATASCLSEAETPRTMHTEKYAEKDDVPRTPSRKMTRVGDAQIGADGLPTPSATRSRSGTGSRRNGRIMHFDPAELDAEMSAEEEEEEEEARMLLKGSLATPPATPVSARGQRAVAQRRAHTEVDVASSSTYAEVAWSPPAEGTVLETWHPLFDLSSLPPIPRATLPSLRDPAPSLYGNGGGLFAAQGIRGLAQSRRLPGFGSDKAGSAQTQAHAGPETPVKGVSTAAEVDQSTAGRATSLLDRIRAKETAKRAELLRASQRRSSNQAASGTGAGVPADGNVELAGIMSSFKRRSTLSRLPDVAEALYLLFTSSSTPSSLPTRRRVPVLPLADVLSSIGKSAKVALSRAEAREALELLRELAPGFVEIRKVGNGEWATLKTGEMAVGLKEVRERIRRELVAE